MEKRVKVVITTGAFEFEDEINQFLKSVSGKLHEIEFSHTPLPQDDLFAALLIYTPEVE
jgi:hypothetical protein